MSLPEDEANVVRPWALPEIGDPAVNAHLIDERRRSREEAQTPPPPTAEMLQEMRDAARQEGYEEGLRQGLSEGRARMDQALAAERTRWQAHLAPLLDALARPLDSMDDTAEQALVQLAMSLAKQIIRRELHTDPGQIIAVVREAIKLLPQSRQHLRVFLHPEDAKLVRDVFAVDADSARSWQILDDPTLTRGGCRLNTDDSQVDATLESRLNALFAHVLGDQREQERHG